MREKVNADSQRSFFELLFRREVPRGAQGRKKKDANGIKALAGLDSCQEAAEWLFYCFDFDSVWSTVTGSTKSCHQVGRLAYKECTVLELCTTNTHTHTDIYISHASCATFLDSVKDSKPGSKEARLNGCHRDVLPSQCLLPDDSTALFATHGWHTDKLNNLNVRSH